MKDPKSNASPSEKKDLIPLGILRLIGYGYVVVFLFFAVFFIFLAEAGKLSPGLGNPRWPLLMAAILVLPLFLPAFKYIAPYIKSIKVSDFELSFVQAEVASYSLATLTSQLKDPTNHVSAPEYAQMIAESGFECEGECLAAPTAVNLCVKPISFHAPTLHHGEQS